MLLIGRFQSATLIWLLTTASAQMPDGHNRRLQTVINKELENITRNSTAKMVLDYINFNINPCEDFFEFACGKWIEDRQANGKGNIITPQSELEYGALKDLEAILSISEGQMPLSQRKIHGFYQKCNTAPQTSLAQKNVMNTLRDQLIDHDNFDWLGELAKMRSNFGLNILIGFDIDLDIETSRGNSIYLGEPQTTIISPDVCNADVIATMSIRDEVFEKLTEEISKSMQNWMSMRENEAKRFANEIVAFEFRLCKFMRKGQEKEAEEENDIQPNLRRLPISNTGPNRLRGRRINGEMTRAFLNDLAQFENTIDLRRYVNTIINYPYNEQVYLRGESYLRELANLLRGIPKQTLGKYILYRVLSELNFPVGNDFSKRDHCARMVKKLFPKITGEVYQRRYQRQDTRRELESYFTDIIKTFEESLNADWITGNTKRTAHQKLTQFKAHFPVYMNLDLNESGSGKETYWQILLLALQNNARQDLERLVRANPDDRPNAIESFDVGAQLIPMDNEILVGWALLQPPFYDENYTHGMKYALLGQRLARELVFAFDEQGWRPNALNQRQWDAATEEGFRNQSECFRRQYSNYLYNNPSEFQNATRLREIIADSSALNLAFRAYSNWLQNMDSSNRGILAKETLPGVNFTNTQLFFIHFAQTRCAAKPGETPPPDYLPSKKHTPQRYDVNGPLSNFVEFARDFRCTVGEEMHSPDKCVIYE